MNAQASWVITLPMKCEWDDYLKELQAVEDYSGMLNFRIPFPVKALEGDRCYLVWRGLVRGWMRVSGVVRHPQGFTCLNTGVSWPPGVYIQRAGPFHLVDGPEMRGFQEIRRFVLDAGHDVQHAEREA